MRTYTKKVISHPLFSGSLVMIIGSNATNALNYIYHLLMGRLLGPAHYGELAALFSLIGLLGMVPLSLGQVIIKYISAAKSDEEIHSLMVWLNRWVVVFSLGVAILIAIASPFLAQFLNISPFYLILFIALAFLFSIPSFLYRSALQGLIKFSHSVVLTLLENCIKLFLGVGLVYLGYSVGGALFALVIASFSSWILGRHFMRSYLHSQTDKVPDLMPLVSYSLPVLVQSVAVTSLLSADLVMVKHFFGAHDAGIYASVSTLGKIIYFGAGPVSAVMFPIVSKRQAEGRGYQRVFFLSLILTAVLSGVVLAFYSLYPTLAIKLLYGSLYLDAAGLLIYYGLFMTLFTISSVLISYFMSLAKTSITFIPTLCAGLQIAGIWVFHDSLQTVILVNVYLMVFMIVALLGFTLWQQKPRTV